MNLSKGTVCLQCIEERRIFNFQRPDIVVENLLNKGKKNYNSVDVLGIGQYDLNKTFIYNELKKILLQGNKGLYNKAVFIDFHRYASQFFYVVKSPNCSFCNQLTVYNPL